MCFRQSHVVEIELLQFAFNFILNILEIIF